MCWLRLRRELKILALFLLSDRSLTPYALEIASAISSTSIESRPSPSPYKGAVGLTCAGSISSLRVVTMTRANSSSSAVSASI